jgi:hypothetical protein
VYSSSAHVVRFLGWPGFQRQQAAGGQLDH